MLQMKQHKSFATSAPTTPPMSPLTPHTTNSTIFAKLLHAVQYPFNKSPQQPSSPPPTPHATPSPSATSTPSTQKTQVSSLAAKASALGNPFFRCVFSLISYPSRITLQALTTVAVALSSATHLPVSAMFRLSRWCSKSPFPVSATKSAEPYNLTADCSTTTSISPATSAPSSDTSNGPSAKSANSSEQQQPQQTQRAQLPKVPKRIPQLQRKPKSARRMHQVLDTPVAASFRLQLAQQLQLRMALFLQMTQLQHIANRCAVTQLFSSAQLWYLQRQLAVRDAKIAQLGREVGHYLATTVVAECMAVQQQQQLEQQLKGQLLQQASALAQAQAVIGRQSTAFAQQTSVMHEMQQRHAQQTSAMREMQHTNAHQASAIAQKDAQLAEYEAKIAAMAAKLEQHERLETKRHPVYSANVSALPNAWHVSS